MKWRKRIGPAGSYGAGVPTTSEERQRYIATARAYIDERRKGHDGVWGADVKIMLAEAGRVHAPKA